MRWGVLFAVLFGLYILEGTVFQIFSIGTQGEIMTLPRFILVVLIFISLYLGRRTAFILGLLFGLFMDIQYSDVIGVYAFSMSIIPYLSARAYQYFQLNVILIIITVWVSVFAHETLVFYLFQLFGLTGQVLIGNQLQVYQYNWLDHIPTAFLNAFFAILFYRPLDKLLRYMHEVRQDEGV